MSESDVIPEGLLDPVSCRIRRWTAASAEMMDGRIKWKAKTRVRVPLSIENPPQIHSTKLAPREGIAERRFVMMVVLQKDICPRGRTNAVAVTVNNNTIPKFHVSEKV